MVMISFCDLPVAKMLADERLLGIEIEKYRHKSILIGSYFCDTYFFNTISEQISTLVEIVDPVAVSLVLPVFRNEYLDRAKKIIHSAIESLGSSCHEIVVNDPGMLVWVSKNFTSHQVVLGRLFYKNARDPRAPWYKNENIVGLIESIVRSYEEIAHPLAIEVDKLDDSCVVVEGVKVRAHRPFPFLTTGFICKAGSIHLTTDRKFRPSSCCRMECCEVAEISHWSEPPAELVRIGRTVFTITMPALYEQIESNADVVWWPLLEVAKSKGWIAADEAFGSTQQH